jgi:hypothetical protein
MKLDAENARSFVDAIEAKGAEALKAHMARISQHADHVHTAAMTAMEQAHEKTMADQQAAVAMAQQAGDQAHEQSMATQAQEAQAQEPAEPAQA